MGCRIVRPQRYRIYFDRHAHVTDADSVRVVPREQQLHPEFDRLLWMPFGGVPKHHDDWRQRSEPRHSRFSNDCRSLLDVPSHHNMGGWSL
jgi:hypothetical protein